MRSPILAMVLCACSVERDPRAGLAGADVGKSELSVRVDLASPAVQQIVEEAKALLMGPGSADLAVSRRCHLGNGPPRGWFAVRYLLAADRPDILRVAFETAPSREGRLWGAYGLQLAGELTAQDTEKFARSLDGSVWTCAGCIVLQGTPTDAAKALVSG